MINRHQDLIAAKYAEVYISAAVNDLSVALSSQKMVAADATVNNTLKDILSNMNLVQSKARQVLATAYTQTISTYNIAQEVMHMERVVSSNLSQTLRNSLAFGKSLRK
jgi:conjugative transfer pilus assembly protein TraH